MLGKRIRRWGWVAVALLAALPGAGCRPQVAKEAEEAAAPLIKRAARRGLEAVEKQAAAVWRQTVARSVSAAHTVGPEDLTRQLPAVRAQLFRAIDRGLQRPPRISIAPREVKGFVDSFKAGARSPARFLNELGAENQALLREWQAVPREKRVFLVGSGEDVGLALRLRADLEREGFRLFFYKFCQQCSSEVVGAFYGTAREAILMDTANARASRFVGQEVSAAIRHQKGTRLAFLVPAEDLLRVQEIAGQVGPRALAKAVPLVLEDPQGGNGTDPVSGL